MSELGTFEIEAGLLFSVLDVLRLAHIYALKDSEFKDELGDDFKPWKWKGFEKDFAADSSSAYAALVQAMTEYADRGEDPGADITEPEDPAHAVYVKRIAAAYGFPLSDWKPELKRWP